MKAVGTILTVLTLAALDGCSFIHPSDPTVDGSTLRIEIAKRGDIQGPAGLLKDVIYIAKPPLCACPPNTDWTVFVLDASGHSATQVKAHFGQSAGNLVEVQRGIKAGDRVIASDMVPYEPFPKVALR